MNLSKEESFLPLYSFYSMIFYTFVNKTKIESMDKPMNRIKEVLEERGIKQTWLAEKLGKSFCMVQQAAAKSGGTVSDSRDSECGREGFNKRQEMMKR